MKYNDSPSSFVKGGKVNEFNETGETGKTGGKNVIDIMNTLLLQKVRDYVTVSSDELTRYFDGDAPSGDETTLEEVLDNRWLLLHELIELSELKKIDLDISYQLLTSHPGEVDRAHITATKYELQFAFEAGDKTWVKQRLADIAGWAEDDNLEENLRKECRDLLDTFQLN